MAVAAPDRRPATGPGPTPADVERRRARPVSRRMLLERALPQWLDQVVGDPPLEVVVAVEATICEAQAPVDQLEVARTPKHAQTGVSQGGAGEEPLEAVDVDARRVELPEGVVERCPPGIEVRPARERQPLPGGWASSRTGRARSGSRGNPCR